MVIKVYWASVTSNRKIDGDQARLRNLIESLKLESHWIDITTTRALMIEMREKCRNPKALPPQIFNDDIYLGNVEDLDRSIEENRVMEWLKIDSNSQQTKCNDANTCDSSNPHAVDTVDAGPANDIVKEDKKSEDQKISPVTVELDHAIISNGSSNKANQNIDEDRRRRILGLPPLEKSDDQNCALPPANNDLVESCKSEDVAKLKSLYEAKDAA